MTTATKTAADPVSKMEAAARRTDKAVRDAARHRMHRDIAALVLRYEHGYAPVTIYREVIGVSRNLFKRMESRKPVTWGDLPFDVADAAAVEKFARSAAASYRSAEERAAVAREERDEQIESLLNGYDGVTLSNAEVARRTDLSTARIAQIRLGNR